MPMPSRPENPHLVACRSCGIVARLDSFEDGVPRCPTCARDMGAITLDAARHLVSARKRADRRREQVQRRAEVGLNRTEPSID